MYMFRAWYTCHMTLYALCAHVGSAKTYMVHECFMHLFMYGSSFSCVECACVASMCEIAETCLFEVFRAWRSAWRLSNLFDVCIEKLGEKAMKCAESYECQAFHVWNTHESTCTCSFRAWNMHVSGTPFRVGMPQHDTLILHNPHDKTLALSQDHSYM